MIFIIASPGISYTQWKSEWVRYGRNGKLVYKQDERGNRIPDFSMVGYKTGNTPFPQYAIVKTLVPSGKDDTRQIQDAINELGEMPLVNEQRGCIVLKKGDYIVSKPIYIVHSGIQLKGEGDGEIETVIRYIASSQSDLFIIGSKDSLTRTPGTMQYITDEYIPVGANTFNVATTGSLNKGDHILVSRPATAEWIHEIGMDSIRKLPPNGRQWTPAEYGLHYERVITSIDRNKNLVTVHAPIVMPIDKKYGGATIYKYRYNERVSNTGIEHIRMVSSFTSDTAEDHGWNAILIRNAEHCWVDKVTAVHFGYSCTNIAATSRNITVSNSSCLDPVSRIHGGRRYSFNCDGQLNLIKNCITRNGRHDYVTGGRTCGPNVFVHSSSTKAHADIGPHNRWATGCLFDNIVTDGEIRVQDRGPSGTGHGWSGAYQVFWNCKAKDMVCQQPPMSLNWNIGAKSIKGKPWNKRPDGIWEGTGESNMEITSLYDAQMKERNDAKK